MERTPPLASIGLAVYNGERNLRRALDSLLGQDYPTLELIISDNGSTDGTEAICREYAARDARVRYFRGQTNVGLVRNFNNAFRHARGKYFTWASDNDQREPAYLSRCISVMEEDAHVVLCYSQAAFVDAEGRQLSIIEPAIETRGLPGVSAFHVVLWGMTHPHQFYGVGRSSAVRRTRLLQNTFGADVVWLLELSLLGSFAYVPELLMRIRKIPDLPGKDPLTDYAQKFVIRYSTPRLPLLLAAMARGEITAARRSRNTAVGRLCMSVSVVARWAIWARSKWTRFLMTRVRRSKDNAWRASVPMLWP